MKFPRYNPFFHEEPPEFDVKFPSAHRGRNWPLVGVVILSIAVWVAAFWVAHHVIWGGH